MDMITIAWDGSGDFTTLQAALDAVPEDHPQPVEMRMKRGVYRERVIWTKSRITLIAEEGTELVGGAYARQLLPNGETQNTFLTATLLISGDDVRMEGLTIRNDAGDGRQVGQAVALYAAGDRLSFLRCRLIACQDTLFCGPTLRKIGRWTPGYDIPRGVEGIDTLPPVDARQYFRDCFIQGDVDFIFGPYRVWFEGCTLYANERGGFYTAPNTPREQPFGLVFHRCRLTGDCAPGGVYLGRPWRDDARAAFLHCEMDACVHPRGYCDWEQPFRPVTPKLCEYGSTGPGAATEGRHPRMGLLSGAEAAAYTRDAVLRGWKPEA